jgi:hypothetical protein
MKEEKIHIRTWRSLVGVATILSIVVMTCVATGCMTRPESLAAKPAGPAAEPKALTGAELYAINCNRCHPERSPVERNAAEWKTILIHMRVRANLPAAQANTILEYLQANSGN